MRHPLLLSVLVAMPGASLAQEIAFSGSGTLSFNQEFGPDGFPFGIAGRDPGIVSLNGAATIETETGLPGAVGAVLEFVSATIETADGLSSITGIVEAATVQPLALTEFGLDGVSLNFGPDFTLGVRPFSGTQTGSQTPGPGSPENFLGGPYEWSVSPGRLATSFFVDGPVVETCAGISPLEECALLASGGGLSSYETPVPLLAPFPFAQAVPLGTPFEQIFPQLLLEIGYAVAPLAIPTAVGQRGFDENGLPLLGFANDMIDFVVINQGSLPVSYRVSFAGDAPPNDVPPISLPAGLPLGLAGLAMLAALGGRSTRSKAVVTST